METSSKDIMQINFFLDTLIEITLLEKRLKLLKAQAVYYAQLIGLTPDELRNLADYCKRKSTENPTAV